LSIEVLGSFVLTWEKEILLAGRSQGALPSSKWWDLGNKKW
jgi:hypothetical protein